MRMAALLRDRPEDDALPELALWKPRAVREEIAETVAAPFGHDAGLWQPGRRVLTPAGRSRPTWHGAVSAILPRTWPPREAIASTAASCERRLLGICSLPRFPSHNSDDHPAHDAAEKTGNGPQTTVGQVEMASGMPVGQNETSKHAEKRAGKHSKPEQPQRPPHDLRNVRWWRRRDRLGRFVWICVRHRTSELAIGHEPAPYPMHFPFPHFLFHPSFRQSFRHPFGGKRKTSRPASPPYQWRSASISVPALPVLCRAAACVPNFRTCRQPHLWHCGGLELYN